MQRSFNPSHLPSAFRAEREKFFQTSWNDLKFLPFSQEEGRREGKRRVYSMFDVQCSHLRAFTLIELLTVIAIIGLIAVMAAPVFAHVRKSDLVETASRQMLDDFARARQLAISERSTVCVEFVPANFWGGLNALPWAQLPPLARTSAVVTQLYASQWTGYRMVSLRSVGDQPGRQNAQDLLTVKTLPDGSFIAPLKFSAPSFGSGLTPPSPINRPDLPIYGFLSASNIPFPSSDVLADPNYALVFNSTGGLTLPYVAFNYLGQLSASDGSMLAYDENIPLAFGSVLEPRNLATRAAVQGLPSVTEIPAGNSTSISYNVIHIDRLTGRARLEREGAL